MRARWGAFSRWASCELFTPGLRDFFVRFIAASGVYFLGLIGAPIILALWLYPLSPEMQRTVAPWVIICCLGGIATGVAIGRMKV